jgi:hypothetical protein
MKTEQIMALARDYASDSGDSYYRTATDARYKSLQDAVEQLVQERDEYKMRTQNLMTSIREIRDERDEYQVEADKLAMECKTLRDALAEVLKAEMPTYHDCTDDGEPECHWCIAVKALVKKVPVEVSRDANPDEMNKLHGEDYGVDWEYTRSKS